MTYKAVGSDTTWYDYDLLGNLISVTLPNGTFIEYIIDGQNRRVGKKVDGVFQKGWLYQDQLNPVVELDENGDPALGFVYGTKGHVPNFMVTSTTSYRIITDHLGSVRLVVNAGTGAVMQRLEYDEFGNVIVDTNPGFQPFGYAGGLYDAQTGLVRFGARDYDAETGRWTAKDPIGFVGDNFNLYNYCNNDPINLVDYHGNSPWYWKFIWAVKELLINIAKNKYDDYSYSKKLENYNRIKQTYQDRRAVIRSSLFECLSNCLVQSSKQNGCFNYDGCRNDCYNKWCKDLEELSPIENWLRNNSPPVKTINW